MAHSDKSSPEKHILVAEDDPAARDFFVNILKRTGYRVTAVADGLQARGKLSEGDIDAVLSDIGMPGLNGIQLLQAVGASEKDPPVVLVTGNPDLQTAVDAVNGRAVAYLNKPVDSKKLLDAVGKAVRISTLAKTRRELGDLLNLPHAEQPAVTPKERSALDNAFHTLWMAYQPIVESTNGKPYAYEALVRNDEPTLKAPPDLLRAAEQCGRMGELARTIRASVARIVPTLPSEISVFLNLVPSDLLDEDLYSPSAPLTLHAKRVVLEITERDNLDTVHDLPERLRDLRQLGFRIAVDDLGAGYSGLTSLVSLQPDVVKLDMALVRSIDTNERLRKIVNAVVGALRAEFKTRIVAEGIETAQERDVLKAMNIDLLQGYYFGKPVRTPTPPDPDLVKKPG